MKKQKKKTKKVKVPEGLKGIKFTSPTFRVSFPVLVEPKAFEDKGTKSFTFTMLIPKDSEDISVFAKAAKKAKIEAFGKDKTKWPKMKPWKIDGDDMEDQPEGYEGNFVMRAKSYRKITIYDRNKEKMDIEDVKEKIFGGSFGEAVLVAKVVKGPSDIFLMFYAQAYRYVKTGEQLGGGASADDFEDYEDEEDEESEEESEDEDSDDDDDSDDDED
jgi:hypothetical protein